MDNAITRAEHDEFVRRMDEANRRLDKRLETAEVDLKELRKLTTSVEKLAQSVETFAAELKKQGERLETLENRDGELWRKILAYALTAGAGFLLCALFRLAGIF